MNHRNFAGELIMQVWFPPNVPTHIVREYQLTGQELGIWNGPTDGVLGERTWAMMRSLGFDPDKGA